MVRKAEAARVERGFFGSARASRLARVPASEADGRRDFRSLVPGTMEWRFYWRDHPGDQEEMLAHARRKGFTA